MVRLKIFRHPNLLACLALNIPTDTKEKQVQYPNKTLTHVARPL